MPDKRDPALPTAGATSPEGLNMLPIPVLLLLALTTAGCATHVASSGRVVVRDDRTAAEVHFSDHDRRVIEEHYRAQRTKRSPPGLAKRETLPPGLAKREALPPGLQGRQLPGELESRLSVLPGPYARLVIGRDVVIMMRSTRVVQDILYGVAD